MAENAHSKAVDGMQPALRSEVERALEVLTDSIKGYIDRSLASAHERLKKVEVRISLAESKSENMRYRGVYQRAQPYARGNWVTHDGSLFIALRDVDAVEVPTKSDAWQLAVKAGRPG